MSRLHQSDVVISGSLEVSGNVQGLSLSYAGEDTDARYLLLDGTNSPVTGDVTFNANVKLNFSDSQIYGDGTSLHLVPDLGSNTGKLKIADGVEITNTSATDPILKMQAAAGTGKALEILKDDADDLFKIDSDGIVYGAEGTVPFKFFSQTSNDGITPKGLFEFYREGSANGSAYHTKWLGAAGATILDMTMAGQLRYEGSASQEYIWEGGVFGGFTLSAGPLLLRDNVQLQLGADGDATIAYDTTNLVINPRAVGGGDLQIVGDVSGIAAVYASGFYYQGQDTDLRYLRLDGTNSPMTGDLSFPDDKGIKLGNADDAYIRHSSNVHQMNAGSKHFEFYSTNAYAALFPDDDALAFGTGADLKIYHDGTRTLFSGNLQSRFTRVGNRSVIFGDDPGGLTVAGAPGGVATQSVIIGQEDDDANISYNMAVSNSARKPRVKFFCNDDSSVAANRTFGLWGTASSSIPAFVIGQAAEERLRITYGGAFDIKSDEVNISGSDFRVNGTLYSIQLDPDPSLGPAINFGTVAGVETPTYFYLGARGGANKIVNYSSRSFEVEDSSLGTMFRVSNAHAFMPKDNSAMYWGVAADGAIYWDGSSLVLEPGAVSEGDVKINSNGIQFGAGGTPPTNKPEHHLEFSASNGVFIGGGTSSSNWAGFQTTSHAQTWPSGGYSAFMMNNLYYDRTNSVWRQPDHTSIASHAFAASHHGNFSWLYVPGNTAEVADAAVEVEEVMTWDPTGGFQVANGAISGVDTVMGKDLMYGGQDTDDRYQRQAFASIAVDGNTSETVISGAGEAAQIDYFTQSSPSYGMTPSTDQAHIEVLTSGIYRVDVAVSLDSVTGGASTCHLEVYKNDGATHLVGIHATRTLAGGAGETGAASMTGIAGLDVGDTVEAWVTNTTGSENYVIKDLTLVVERLR